VSPLPGEFLFRLASPGAREKGFARWHPKRGTIERRALAHLLWQIRLYSDHLPIGPRTLTYRLLPAWVPSSYRDKNALQKMVVATLTKARRAGLIPFAAIDDARTSRDGPLTTASLPALVKRMHVDRQAGQPWRIELWVETKGNVGRLANICTPYGVDVYSGSGSVPIKANLQTAQRIVRAQREFDQPTLLLLLTDFDPAGLKNIAAALHDDVLAFVNDLGGDPSRVVIRHLGITAQQALAVPQAAWEFFNLSDRAAPKDWPVAADVRGERWGVKVELEALPPDQLDALVVNALASVRDEDAYRAALAAEGDGRVEALEALARSLKEA